MYFKGFPFILFSYVTHSSQILKMITLPGQLKTLIIMSAQYESDHIHINVVVWLCCWLRLLL